MDHVDNIQSRGPLNGPAQKSHTKANGAAPFRAPRRAFATKSPVQAFATDSSALGLSKNCSSSVDPLSAVVEDCPPCTVCVTASK